MFSGNTKFNHKFDSGIDVQNKSAESISFKNTYVLEAFDKYGNIKWTEVIENLVVNTGLDDVLTQYWKGSAYTALHYIGLTSGTPAVAATDTMLSHPGWTEVTAYTETARPTLNLGTVVNQSIDNSASKAVFSINATTTIGGAFITTDSTKGGTAGTLVASGAFASGDRSLISGDTLNVTITITISSV